MSKHIDSVFVKLSREAREQKRDSRDSLLAPHEKAPPSLTALRAARERPAGNSEQLTEPLVSRRTLQTELIRQARNFCGFRWVLWPWDRTINDLPSMAVSALRLSPLPTLFSILRRSPLPVQYLHLWSLNVLHSFPGCNFSHHRQGANPILPQGLAVSYTTVFRRL